MRNSFFCCLLFLGPLGVAQQSIIVNLELPKSTDGTIRAALYNSEESFLSFEQVYASKGIRANASPLTLNFEKIPEGHYAIALYHDINDNEKMDTNIMGIPKEPLAFSNAAMGMFGPPSFKKAMFYHKDHTILNISF